MNTTSETAETRSAFVAASRKFNNASALLVEIEWPSDEGYPFTESFEELQHRIMVWHQAVRTAFGQASSASGDRPEPRPFVETVTSLADAAYKMLRAWEELSFADQDAITPSYPFAKSFDDVVHQILDWKEAVAP